ncbi:hypothetical protein GPECTOR_276g724 [Gonium pectorale]|uniref:Expansin-like EG45 domain-containing protein n=1 Tax=Gonium pectorale TaxID=33097 RepID=A0A150FXQ3_GONPE|nr:hypothetical protein GPECTOR_276g724 [Gonium pectorale]|eukprot:KXZ41810.1 hypothetical protein GPECTOR_276g724 [Gonium pectorale]
MVPFKPAAVVRLLPLAVVALLLHLKPSMCFDFQWHTGRATHYGGEGDPWSIHNGHCAYGYLDPNVGTGWDICAPSDQNWDYDASTASCGVCYEIACQGMDFNDFYGNFLDRKSVCYDQDSSVVVMVSDICPCYYPSNQYSNKRWCCGDMQHFDVSVFAFQKLADVKWGVIGIKYRRVPCDHQPYKKAYLPSGATPAKDSQSPPWNWDSSKDKRWALWSKSQSWNFGGDSSSKSDSQLTSSVTVTYEQPQQQSTSVGQQSTVTNAYYGGFMQGWTDSGSWSISKWGRDASWGFDGQQAYCVTLSGYGGAKFNAWSGVFSSKRTLEFYARQNNGGTPDISVKLASPSGTCKSISLQPRRFDDNKGGWTRFQIPLKAFDWRQSGDGDGGAFSGCSDSINDWSADTLFFVNNWGGNQDLCLDQVKIF